MANQIDKYFHHLIEKGGSDLHLSEGQPPKIRVHGAITAIEGESVLSKDVLEGMMKEIAEDEAWQRYLSSGDLDFAYEMDSARTKSTPNAKNCGQRPNTAAPERKLPCEWGCVLCMSFDRKMSSKNQLFRQLPFCGRVSLLASRVLAVYCDFPLDLRLM